MYNEKATITNFREKKPRTEEILKLESSLGSGSRERGTTGSTGLLYNGARYT